MKLARNLKINVGDLIKFESSAMYLCINSNKKSDEAVLLNILDNSAINIRSRNMDNVDTSSISEIRDGHKSYITSLLFNDFLPNYKNKLYTTDKLWTEIKKYTYLKWSRKSLNLMDSITMNDILIINDAPYIVYTIYNNLLGSKEISITRLDKKKNELIHLIDVFRYEDDIYRNDNHVIDIRDVDKVLHMTDDFLKELSNTCTNIKAEFKENDYLSQLNDKDKFILIYDSME